MNQRLLAEMVAGVLIERLPANLYDDLRDDFREVSYAGCTETTQFADAIVKAMESETR